MKFLYNDYGNIIHSLKKNGFNFIKYNEADTFRKEVILRHDVDVSLEKAVELARYESSLSIQATYYILLTSAFYNVLDRPSINLIKEIHSLGHSIGLHFDETNYFIDLNKGEVYQDKIKKLILKERSILENILEEISIDCVSMHIPSKETLDANISFEDEFINSYGEKYFKGYKYVSDSEMRWRENVNEIITDGEYDKLHILTHPIWYDKTICTKEEKIVSFLSGQKKQLYNEINIIVPNIDKTIRLSDF